jgi:hypothetical protein
MSHNITKSVSFDAERDRRLLAEIEKLPRREFAKTVRTALRAHFGLESGVTPGMIYAKLAEIERRLDNGAATVVERRGDESGDILSSDILSAFD